MKFLRIIAFSLVAIAAAAAFVSFQTANSRGQSQQPKADKAEVTVKPTVMVTESRNSAAEKSSSIFSDAAAQNAVLQNELTWTFGGKQQHGWYLYDLLIGQTL